MVIWRNETSALEGNNLLSHAKKGHPKTDNKDEYWTEVIYNRVD